MTGLLEEIMTSQDPHDDFERPPLSYKFWHLKVRGSYKDLCQRLGQELFEDVVKVKFLRDHIPQDLLGQMQTESGKALLHDIVRRLEDFEALMTPAHVSLRQVCQKMNFKGRTARPSWANGAHIFVTAEVASEIEDAFKPGDLNKGDLIVSPEFLEDVRELLFTPTDRTYRGCAYIHEPTCTRRALGAFSTVDAVLARNRMRIAEALLDPISFQWVDRNVACSVQLMASARTNLPASSLKTRLTHSTGSAPHSSKDVPELSWGHSQACVQRAALDGLSLCPSLYKQFKLKQSNFLHHTETSHQILHIESAERLHISDESADHANDRKDDIVNDDEVSIAESTLTSSTVLTSLTHVEAVTVSFSVFMRTRFEIRARRVFKSPQAYAEYSQEHIARLLPEVVNPLLQAAPLEANLAPICHEDESKKKECLMSVFKMLNSMVLDCFNSKCLSTFLRASWEAGDVAAGLLRAFEESTELLADEFGKNMQPILKELLQERRRKFKKYVASYLDDGLHKIADSMRSTVLEAVEEASSKIDIRPLARRAWLDQKGKPRPENDQKAEAEGNADSTKQTNRKFGRRQLGQDRKNVKMDDAAANHAMFKYPRSQPTKKGWRK